MGTRRAEKTRKRRSPKTKARRKKQKEAVRQELDKIESLVIDEGTEVILPNAYKNLTNLRRLKTRC